MSWLYSWWWGSSNADTVEANPAVAEAIASSGSEAGFAETLPGPARTAPRNIQSLLQGAPQPQVTEMTLQERRKSLRMTPPREARQFGPTRPLAQEILSFGESNPSERLSAIKASRQSQDESV